MLRWSRVVVSRVASRVALAAVVSLTGLVGALGVGSIGIAATPVAQAREAAPVAATQAAVALSELPPEARQTHRLILVGGPFPYPNKDGSVFGNRERLLPREPRGYYREYTVPTPGSRDRGARRIVCGGNQPRSPDVCYYTQDHYASFRRIVQ
ncbi:ribonuclease domain-containing protein [Leptothrix sp. BB-4]